MRLDLEVPYVVTATNRRRVEVVTGIGWELTVTDPRSRESVSKRGQISLGEGIDRTVPYERLTRQMAVAAVRRDERARQALQDARDELSRKNRRSSAPQRKPPPWASGEARRGNRGADAQEAS